MIDSRHLPPCTPGLVNAAAIRRALCQRIDAASAECQTAVSPPFIRRQTSGVAPECLLRRDKFRRVAGKGDLDTPGG